MDQRGEKDDVSGNVGFPLGQSEFVFHPIFVYQ